MAECWAQEDLAILITGETGTGKDLLARYVRWMSPRRLQPFVTIDLNTVPESLWESELFGHRKGTFTGAAGEKTGLLESADHGTVFLNEIGNLPVSLQAKLLEFLDTRKVRPLGHARPKTLDVRFIAATNTELTDAVAAGRFRSDLYYRLEQAPLHLLPLRHRREDIPLLLEHFLRQGGVSAPMIGHVLNQRWVKRASDLPWSGNVRQLRHFTQRLVTLAGRRANSREFGAWAERLIDHMRRNGNGNGNGNGHGKSAIETEREELMDVLARHAWNQRATARDLGISEGGLRHRMRRLKVTRPFR
jgi:transcriptional regulator with GAF, ATPase, and Fis domain